MNVRDFGGRALGWVRGRHVRYALACAAREVYRAWERGEPLNGLMVKLDRALREAGVTPGGVAASERIPLANEVLAHLLAVHRLPAPRDGDEVQIIVDPPGGLRVRLVLRGTERVLEPGGRAV